MTYLKDRFPIPEMEEAAIAYLARYSNTETGLRRVLEGRLRRWVMRVKKQGMDESEINDVVNRLQDSITDVIKKMKKIGAVDDESYAQQKTSSLIRTGNSKNAIRTKLLSKGVNQDIIQSALEVVSGTDSELFAGLIYARKRRIGPFKLQNKEITDEDKRKAQMRMIRAGFSSNIIRELFQLSHSEAEEIIYNFKAL